MTARSRDDEARAFESAMRGIEPLEPARRRSGVRRSRRTPSGESAPSRFTVSEEGLEHYGVREDVGIDLLGKLREGRIEPANRLDLHGMSEEAARDQVFRFLRQSVQSGLPCVALVHGRGLRSPDGPVLKRALPAWLTQLPVARLVRAFASAPRERGGDGVTFVLLSS